MKCLFLYLIYSILDLIEINKTYVTNLIFLLEDPCMWIYIHKEVKCNGLIVVNRRVGSGDLKKGICAVFFNQSKCMPPWAKHITLALPLSTLHIKAM